MDMAANPQTQEIAPSTPLAATLEAREWNVIMMALEAYTGAIANKLMGQLNAPRRGTNGIGMTRPNGAAQAAEGAH